MTSAVAGAIRGFKAEPARGLIRVLHLASVLMLGAWMWYFTTAGAHAGDAHAYWQANFPDPYTTGVNEEDAYLYSPAFLHALLPLKWLPWDGFYAVFTALNLAVLAWMVGPLVAVLTLLPGPYSPVFVNLWFGNIGILMAAALVLAFRSPAAWSFLLLTKITPGVGLLYFAAQRRWRYVATAFAVTTGIVAASFVLAPGAWVAWPAHLSSTSPEIFPLPPLWIRLVAAALIAVVGGATHRPWTVALAAVIAQPVFWFTGFSMLLAWVGLLRHRTWLQQSRDRIVDGGI